MRYVTETGNDSENSCLVSASPCRTVGWAYAQAQAGDEIKIAAGVYTNPDMAVETRFLTLDKTLTLAGGYSTSDWDAPDPELNPTALDGEDLGTILLSDTPAITITVSISLSSRGSGYGINFRCRLLLTNSVVISTTTNCAIYLYDSDGSQIVASTIANNYRRYRYYNDNLLLENNTITGNSSYGVDLYYNLQAF